MTVEEWLASARADAERRGLNEVVPVLQTLAEAMARLRAEDPDAATAVAGGGPAPPPGT